MPSQIFPRLFATSRSEMEIIMKQEITDETMEYIGILAKLSLSEEEREQAKKDMNQMLSYIEKMNELDTDQIEPVTHLFDLRNVYRDDEITNSDWHEELLGNAPQEKDHMLVVPKTFE